MEKPQHHRNSYQDNIKSAQRQSANPEIANEADGLAQGSADERETANSGDWDDLLPSEKDDVEGDTDSAKGKNDSPGGAGSTGSAATNSSDKDTL